MAQDISPPSSRAHAIGAGPDRRKQPGRKTTTTSTSTNRTNGERIEAPAPVATETFGQQVLAAARKTETGRFGSTLIFINHVWRTHFSNMPLATFKADLCKAARAREIKLVTGNILEAELAEDAVESRTGGENCWELINLVAR